MINNNENLQDDSNDKIKHSIQHVEKLQNKQYNAEKKIIIIALLCFVVLVIYVIIHSYTYKQVQPYIPEKYRQSEHPLTTSQQQTEDNPQDKDIEPEVSADNIDYKNSLVFWGDSFATNYNNNPNHYINELLDFVLSNSYNISGIYCAGVYEDPIQMTLARQGSAPMLVNPFTIPANCTPVPITLSSTLGGELTPTTVNKGGINPCIIASIEGTMSYSDGKLYFARNTEGESVIVDNPSIVTTGAMKNIRDCTQILFVGNLTQSYEVDELVSIYKQFADNIDTGKYLIIGNLNGDFSSNQPFENAMRQTFGEHYLNLRAYLTSEVFDDYSINLNFTDIQSTQKGIVPSVFLSDNNTFTDAGNEIVASVISKKLIELHYLQK